MSMRSSDDMEDAAALVREALAAQREFRHSLLRVNPPDWVELDLSMGQLKTLMALASQEGMNVSAVAETLRVGKPAASILVDRLVQLGYAQRTEDPEDRRRTLVTPTAHGRELVERLRQGGGERTMVRWLEQMNPDDLAALAQGLRALAAVARRETEQLDAAASGR
jgi:DNA-binding MarR family transcriptional regulator